MKDHLRSLVRGLDPLVGRNVLREYLQARILEGLQRAGAMSPLAFQGGTALRFLYSLRRYSEDLDFALEGPRELYDLRGWMRAVARQLRREGYEADASVRDHRTVHTGWIRVRGVLYETGLSPHRDETLSVKADVDTNPPAGAVTRTRLIRRHVSLRLHHHDRASLLAGKLHAVLCRPWAKGRDIYDLAWYLSDPTWPSPNLKLLNAAVRQTNPEVRQTDAAVRQTDAELRSLDETTWPLAVAKRVEGLSWDAVVDDVRPFLEGEEEMVGKADVLGLLGTGSPPHLMD